MQGSRELFDLFELFDGGGCPWRLPWGGVGQSQKGAKRKPAAQSFFVQI